MFKEDMEKQIKDLKKQIFFEEDEEKKKELKELLKDSEEELIFLPTRDDLKEYWWLFNE